MNANDRIQWFHKKIIAKCYPNASHLSEKFDISHRQAQRDVEFLKKELDAPLGYDKAKKGYFYTEEYALPIIIETENDADYQTVISGLRAFNDSSAERSVIQMQLPYTAVLEITDKMTVMNLRSFIVGEEPHHRYRCEFPSIELFLGIIVTADANIKVVSPDWLRERLVELASRILQRNT
jgi:predicted DNA-binding transcriptional regulator YafY